MKSYNKLLIRLGVLASLLVFVSFVGCTITDPGYMKVVDDNTNIITIDPTTRAIVALDEDQYQTHEGNGFFLEDVVDLAINNVGDIQITTPALTEWTHFTFIISTEKETEWYLYENVTINLAGAGQPAYNSDRNSGHGATLVVGYIENANIADANADTAVAGATELMHGTSGAGRDAGMVGHAHEMILEQNQDYTIRFVATVAGYVNFHLDWYEYTNY